MLIEALLAHAEKTPDQVALRDESGGHTYQQLASASAAMAGLLARQTGKENVGLMLPAGAGFVASFFGTLLAGKSVVPVNFLLGDREVAHVLGDSGIDTVITIPQLAGKIKSGGLKIIDLTQLGKPPTAETWPPIPPKGPDDMAVLMYTSGTSGLPKGVILTYNNLQSDVDACIERACLTARHHFLGVIPMFHSFGMTGMMLAPLQLGSTIICLARFSAVAAVQAVRQYSNCLLFGVPSMLAAMVHLKSAGKEDFRSIYAVISGGEPLPIALREKFEERFGTPIYEGYGLTETSPVVALNMPHNCRHGSVGKPFRQVEVKIVDDDGHPLPPGQNGEIWLRGPMVTRGYYHLPEETAAVFAPEGFFKTGDLGRLDADGFLYITGRKKDLIIIAGEKASPREIEDVLLRHPAVAEAAVMGKIDAGRGESVAAFIIARPEQHPDAAELREFCRAQGLAQWKIPREIFFRPDLPRSPTGKVLKRVLVEQLAAGSSA